MQICTCSSGNRYYLEHVRAGEKERRSVQYAERVPDIHALPMEWWSWLRHTRRLPPTALEIRESDARRARLAERVAALESEDLKQRIREQSTKSTGNEEALEPRGITASLSGSYPVTRENAHTPSSRDQNLLDFEPEQWKPASPIRSPRQKSVDSNSRFD